MTRSHWTRPAPVLVALAALSSAPAHAQEWLIVSGAASRAEYTDNYFYTASTAGEVISGSPESAFTLSLIPFVAAVRRTETSEVKALVSVGANKAWGVSEEYLTARTSLDGNLRTERSLWTGTLSYERTPELQNILRDGEVLLALNYTDNFAVGGSYLHQLSDRWTAGATAGASYNRFESVQQDSQVSDDVNYSAVGDLRYSISESTTAVTSLSYVYSVAEVTRTDIVTTRIAVIHQYSPRLSISGSVGYFWSDARNRGAAASLEDVGREDGALYGARIEYTVLDGTRVALVGSQGLTSSAVGTPTKNDFVGLSLVHRFSETLSGQVGASYSRNKFTGALEDAYSDKTLQGEIGLSWRLAERWSLDAGYRYSRTKYSQEVGEPKSNVVYASIAYNWPGASLTGRVGTVSQSQSLTGAASLTPSDVASPGLTPAPGPGPSVPETPPFEPFTLP